jgi:uncharacterized peroxidase-related enzyme
MPRLPYLNKEDLPEEDRAAFDALRLPDGRMMNVHRMMAHRPKMLQRRSAFSRVLNNENLVERGLRELALLTVGRLTRGVYEYHHHAEFARQAGVSAEKMIALPIWENHPIFSERERAVIRYSEQMTRDVQVTGAAFAELRRFFSTGEIVDLTLLIAHYNSTVRFLEALQVLPDEDGGH